MKLSSEEAWLYRVPLTPLVISSKEIVMEKEEYGWMVEAEECGRSVWLCMVDGTIIWSADPNLAMRFCRCEDGEAMARYLCRKLPGGTLGGLRVTDHIWS